MSKAPRKCCARKHPSAARRSLLLCLRSFFYCIETEVTQWEKPELPDDGADEARFRELAVRPTTPLRLCASRG